MSDVVPWVIALFALVIPRVVSAQDAAPRTGVEFAATSPESQGLDPKHLDALATDVQRWIDEEKLVGAELLVIRKDHVVFHRAVGWKHREERVPMELNSIFCVRSMTKPVAGTAIQMLVDDGRLSLDDRVGKHLASFDAERTREITIEQLATHRAGLTLSSLLGRRLADLASLREIADATAARGPEFPIGEGYHYSDDGADTLGAIVEQVSGQRLDVFLRERLFEPLGMRDTIAILSEDDPLRARVVSNYAGSTGAWTRYWSPKDPPLFPILLASQGLYTTPMDYARFLCLWKERGRAAGERLLSTRAVRRALAPAAVTRFPTTFPGLVAHYGQMMMLWIDPSAPAGKGLVAFGHGGSDGTHAWVWPELDLMVLYFTQSRGNTTGIDLEALLQEHVVDPLVGTLRAPKVAYSNEELDAIAGLYWDEDSHLWREIARDGERMTIEFPGKAVLGLEPTSTRDRWTLQLTAGHLDVERSESGAVAGLSLATADPERWPRWVPAADLPSVAALMERRKHAVDWERIGELGTLRLSGRQDLDSVGLHGSFVVLVQGLARCRFDYDYGAYSERMAVDGERAWRWNSREGLTAIEDALLVQAKLEHPLVVISDWRELFADLTLIARFTVDGEPALLVRAVARGARARALLVSEATGLTLGEQGFARVSGMGELGYRTRYSDWREVGAVRLPFAATTVFSTKLLGEVRSQVEAFEAHVDVADDAFVLEEPKQD